MIKGVLKLSRDAVVALIFPFVRTRYKTIWRLRDRIFKAKHFNRYLLELCYWKWCSRYCAWIGLGADINGCIKLPHDLNGVFISNRARIGKNCIILHQVTIGSEVLRDGGAPVIGENVFIGAGAKVIGEIKIGDNCRIGANACVYKDVPANCVVVGNPMRVIQKSQIENKIV